MVHQYQLNGYNIVLDTCSGSVHVVDEVAYDVIAMYPEHTADEIVVAMLAKYGSRPDVTEEDLRQCIDDVTSLKENGKLFMYHNHAAEFQKENGILILDRMANDFAPDEMGFTLDTYAHVTTDAQLKAAQTMGNILSRAV